MASAQQTAELSLSGISAGFLSADANTAGVLAEAAQLWGVLSTGARIAGRLSTKAVLRGELSGSIRYIEIPGSGGELSNITVRSGKATFLEVPAAGFYGIGSVTVEGDPDLVPQNIKNGVTILDVVGSYVPDSVKLTAKSLSITANGKYTLTPGAGYDGMSRVVVTADVPQEVVKVDAVLQSKSVTPSSKNQTVTPDADYDALSSVTVYGDSDLIPENIRKDVNIFGVVGTYDLKQYFQSKSVTPGKSPQNIVPDSGYDALSSVYVVGDDDLIAANIREGVSIFGVVGSYSTGINFQHKSVTPTREGFTVTADEGYNALSSVRVNGDSALVPGNIADGETIFGVTGNYVSPMKPITVIPSKDDQRILPAPGYYGFSEITVMAGEATGDYAEGYADGVASRDSEVEYLEERIDTLTEEKGEAYQDGYEDGYADGAASGGPSGPQPVAYLYGGMALPALLPEMKQSAYIAMERKQGKDDIAYPYEYYVYTYDKPANWGDIPNPDYSLRGMGLHYDGNWNVTWYGLDGTEWVFIKQVAMTADDYLPCYPFWANKDIIRTDTGAVYVHGSNEEPEYNPDIIFRATLTTTSKTLQGFERGETSTRAIPETRFIPVGETVICAVDGAFVGAIVSDGKYNMYLGNTFIYNGAGTDDGGDYLLQLGRGWLWGVGFYSRTPGTYDVKLLRL